MGNEANKRKEQMKEDMIQSLIKAHSIKGHKKKMDMTGQDVYDIIKDLSENVKYFAVYDGHGTKGLQAAEGLKSEIRKKLYSDKNKIANFKDINKVESYFKNLYRAIQKKLASTNEFDLSGTCSISVLLVDNKMFVINLGDSRCVLGQRKGGDEKKLGEKIGIEMSIDQKPIREDEKKKNY
jgi:serine/threonine protein phosphatase PrpC